MTNSSFGQGLLDGPIKGGQPGIAELVVRAHLGIAKRMQVDADVGKPGLLDQREVPLLEACLGGRLPQWIVADDVHTTPESLVLGGCVGSPRRCRDLCRQRRCGSQNQEEYQPLRHGPAAGGG